MIRAGVDRKSGTFMKATLAELPRYVCPAGLGRHGRNEQ
jgi:hypothetical protein